MISGASSRLPMDLNLAAEEKEKESTTAKETETETEKEWYITSEEKEKPRIDGWYEIDSWNIMSETEQQRQIQEQEEKEKQRQQDIDTIAADSANWVGKSNKESVDSRKQRLSIKALAMSPRRAEKYPTLRPPGRDLPIRHWGD